MNEFWLTHQIYFCKNMICNSQASKKEKILVQKKRIFKENIRRRHIDQIFTELRQLAQMPRNISDCLEDLPNSLNQLFQIIVLEELPKSWLKKISTSLYAMLKNHPKALGSIPPNKQIPFIILICTHQDLDGQEADDFWNFIAKQSSQWSPPEQKMLLRPLKVMIKKFSTKYLTNAKQILEKLGKIDSETLDFYGFVLQRFPKESQTEQIITISFFQRLVQLFNVEFYNECQKLKMCEILIKATYIMEMQEFTKTWNRIGLFNSLESIISSSNDYLLIDRCLILIYNINIDSGSQIFMLHPCIGAVVTGMEDFELPLKLRQLMAETYLSALINFPVLKWHLYLQKHSKFLSDVLTFIAEEFVDNYVIVESLKAVLVNLLNISSEKEVLVFRGWLLGKVQLVEAIRHCSFGQKLLEEWQLI